MESVKFSVLLSAKHGGDWRLLKELASECERLGYHCIWYADHLSRGGSRLECWTVLSALSTLTKNIRIGPLVLSNTFREPSLVAKMASSLDVISEGRVEFGIGAGSYEPEHKEYGIPFPKLEERVERLDEALTIIKKMWTEEKPTYRGRYYNITDAVCEPKPIQKPYPPITIGGGGKSILRVVALHANRWNVTCSLDDFKSKLSILTEYCTQINRKIQEIEKSIFFTCTGVYPSKEELDKNMYRVYLMEGRRIYDKSGSTVSFEEWLKDVRPRSLVGTRKECIRTIQKFMKVGAKYFILRFAEPPEKVGEKLRVFTDEVIRKIKTPHKNVTISI